MSVLFLLILLPNLFVTFLSTDLAGNLIKQIAYLFFSCLILILPALVFNARSYFLFLSVFFILSPLEIAHILLNRMPVTEGFMSAILNTNKMEAFELLSVMKGYIIAGLLLLVLYYWIVFKKIRNKLLLTRKGKLIVGSIFVVFNISLWATMWGMSDFRADNAHRLIDANSNLLRKYSKTYPFDLIVATLDVFEGRREVSEMEDKLKDFSFSSVKRNEINQREIYVLVIGEAARYGNFSVNGYNRPTSPSLEKHSGLISYQDVLSTGNLTGIVLPLLMTRATPLDPETAHREKALTDAFKESQFNVAWIANQSASDRFIQRITANADFTDFSTTDYDSANNYDGRLLGPLQEILGKGNGKQFIVIHTLGSHFRYNARYPDSFCRFTPALHDNTSYSGINISNKELLVNSYDNSIYYTDYVLNGIIQQLEKENAVSALIYLSDHGENLFDDSSHMSMHGSTEPSLYELHIPLFVWTSEKYNETWPEKVQRISKNRGEKISTTNLFHTMLDLADITYPSEQTVLSFVSPDFEPDTVRFVLTPDKRVVKK